MSSNSKSDFIPCRSNCFKGRRLRASYFAYGTYGTTAAEFFARLEICKASLSTHALKSEVPMQPLEMDMKVQSHSKDDLERAYIQKVVAIYTEQMQTSHINSKIMNEESSPLQERGLKSFNSTIMNKKNSSLLGKELELMMELRLGGNLDFQITQPVLKQQSDFLREREKWMVSFIVPTSALRSMLKKVNDLFGDLLISLPDILGDDNYKKIFDLIPSKDRFVLIDPDIAVKVHKQR